MLGFNKTEHYTSSQKELELVKSQVSALLLHAPKPTLLLDDQYNAIAFNDAAIHLIRQYFNWNLVVGDTFLPQRHLVNGQPIEAFLRSTTTGLARNKKIDCYTVQGCHIQLTLSCTTLLDNIGHVRSICLSIQEHSITQPTNLQEKKMPGTVYASYNSTELVATREANIISEGLEQ